ncbi:MAG: ATP-dependent DNA helicase RecG [Candidatus Omnitrophica bacterium]|nr:ATP-dependent DNA helicase RecG [Candidatus Omnitrophota bacterium]
MRRIIRHKAFGQGDMTSFAETSIQYLKGVGPARMKVFERLGVSTIEDLLYFFPRRYEDRRKLTPILDLKPGEWQTVVGVVTAKGGRRTFFNKKHVFELVLADDHAKVYCVWFNQPYLENYFHPGDRVVLYGRVDVFKDRIQIVSPEYEVLGEGDEGLSTARIVPIYPLTRGITQRYLRRVVHACLEAYAGALPDVIPEDVRARQKLEPVSESIRQIHFPEDQASRDKAERRIGFDEFFLFQVSVILRRISLVQKLGTAHFMPPAFFERFEKAFPFRLTGAQKKSMAEVSKDMSMKRPMLRLLQGDVGSGKTVVSFFGCLAAVTNGKQAAIMAPTEILAQQHYETFVRYFEDGPFGEVRTALLKSGLKKKEKEALCAKIREGVVDVVIGTHALLEEGVEFKALSFVTIDEQHKFGVKQRAVLSAKGEGPDILVMTATPIPRTLCLTLYGDLDVSVIDEKPAGRGTVKTYHFTGEQADGVYKRVAEWVAKGTQAYVVYPVIEESEHEDRKAAVAMYERFCKDDFKNFKVGLVHGKLPRAEALRVMAEFKRGKLDILVTTTILEVGIDVPNANVMVIEHAERFGLSQLHQLRGRIGRSEKNAVCILLGDAQTEDGRRRLEAVVKTGNGFKIAEEDLLIRGPGQYFGRHQHGLNELRVVNPLTQIDVLEAARKEAMLLVKSDPLLKTHRVVRDTICKRYPEYLERVLAG